MGRLNDYCMTCGDSMITKYKVNDEWCYIVRSNGDIVAVCSSFAEARLHAS